MNDQQVFLILRARLGILLLSHFGIEDTPKLFETAKVKDNISGIFSLVLKQVVGWMGDLNPKYKLEFLFGDQITSKSIALLNLTHSP